MSRPKKSLQVIVKIYLFFRFIIKKLLNVYCFAIQTSAQ